MKACRLDKVLKFFHVVKTTFCTSGKKMLLKFKTLISVLSVNDKIIVLALATDFNDFEDAIQYITAIENKTTTMLRRNLKDYKKSEILILTAKQFLKFIG